MNLLEAGPGALMLALMVVVVVVVMMVSEAKSPHTALPTALATVQVPTRPPETTMTSPNTNLDLNFILQ